MNHSVLIIAGAVFFVVAGEVEAFQLAPNGTAAERSMAKEYGVTYRAVVPFASFAMHNFADPAHEALTQKIYGCDGDWQKCSNPDLENAGPYIIAGVRWNDDPVFMPGAEDAKVSGCDGRYSVGFISQTKCWINLFKVAEKKSASDPAAYMGSGNYIARSHFGDLQFLHAMASQEGDSPEKTKQRIMMWAQFAWGVADGTYPINTYLKDVKIEGWEQSFNNAQTVQDLFTAGRPWLRAHVSEVALGSLLHMVQDSFAGGHVQRRDEIVGDKCLAGTEPVLGRIEEFHSYAKQDHEKHKEDDASSVARVMLMQHEPDVVDAGKKLRGYFADRKGWSEVRPYLEDCLFALSADTRPASAGSRYLPE